MILTIREKTIHENNRDYIYGILKQNILEFKLIPGEPINEKELSTSFNLSRTPIREAFIKLAEDGLIDIFPQKGSFISYINLESIDESLFIRKSLEINILKESVISFPPESLNELKKIVGFQKTLLNTNSPTHEFFSLDNQFHQIIFEACSKKNVWKFICNASLNFTRLRFLDSTEKDNVKRIISQHETIIEIIETKNEENISELVHDHVSHILTKIDFLKNKYPNIFIEKN